MLLGALDDEFGDESLADPFRPAPIEELAGQLLAGMAIYRPASDAITVDEPKPGLDSRLLTRHRTRRACHGPGAAVSVVCTASIPARVMIASPFPCGRHPRVGNVVALVLDGPDRPLIQLPPHGIHVV